MDPLQTNYSATMDRWIEGMVLNSEHQNRISRTIETAAGIGFGKVACRGTQDNTCKVSAASAKPLGITILDRTQGTEDKYPQYATVAIMEKGVVVCQASVAVAQGDPVYFVPATGVLTNADTGNIAIPNAVWDTSTSGAGLAAVRLK
jgi:hypothetical protein